MMNVTLFCIPFAGGNKFTFYPLKDKLPNDIDLKPLELPGHGERLNEQPLLTIEDMVDDLTDQIIKEKPEQYIILGYSLGAILAYEIYFRLHKSHHILPSHMILCACEPIGYAKHNNINNMSDFEFKKFIKDKGDTPKEVLNHEELWEIVEPALKNDFLAIDNYHNSYEKKKKMNTTLSIFVGENDTIANHTLYKWSNLTSEHVEYKFFQGSHLFITDAYDQLSEEIKLVLN